MSYGLPKSVDIDGQEFAIRYDYRVILDIFEAMNDPESRGFFFSSSRRHTIFLPVSWARRCV